ncbi:MAG: hypothetical protein ACLFTA_02970 [Candidatus Nanohaloarchaea archaeon]
MLFRSKGQAFAPDFLASIVIMGFMLSIFLISWNSIVNAQIADQRDRNLYTQGERTMKSILNRPGVPEDWNSSNVETLGLTSEPYVLEPEKIEEFEKLDFQRQRSLLKASGFNLEIVGEDVLYSIGQDPDSDQVFSFRRNALINRSGDLNHVEVRYAVWR